MKFVFLVGDIFKKKKVNNYFLNNCTYLKSIQSD